MTSLTALHDQFSDALASLDLISFATKLDEMPEDDRDEHIAELNAFEQNASAAAELAGQLARCLKDMARYSTK